MKTAAKNKRADKKKPKSRVREWSESIGLAVLLVLVVRTFVVEPYKIPTGSMEPTLLGVERRCPECGRVFGYDGRHCPYDETRLRLTRIGDRILVNKFLYGPKTPTKIPFTDILLPYFQFPGFRDPRRWDIVVFHYPENLTQNYVKRLVGLPGETLEIRGGEIWIDGRREAKPEEADFYYHNQGGWGRAGTRYRIPARGDEIALEADNFDLYAHVIRMDGHAAELVGGEVRIDGRTKMVYTVKQNYYYVLGDNSANSQDSRFWGYVPERYLLGNVFFIYWPPRRWGTVN